MESLITLTVKAPNQRIDDVQIDCDLKWSVRRLKEYLQDVYPSKPESSSQRLIYLGKLLQDHDLLKEVFGDWGARTLHLVCAENNFVEEKIDSPPPAPTTTQETPSSESGVNSSLPDSTDGLRFRGGSVPSAMHAMQSPLMSAATSMPNLEHWYQFHQQHQNLQQHPWSHHYHAYMQQYYQHWQHWNMTMNGGQWPHAQMLQGHVLPPTPEMLASMAHLPPQSHAQQPQPQPLQQEPVPNQNQNIRMNAGVGGPPMEDEEEEDNGMPRNRDWLDWLYMSMRMLMLFSIIYFYSSTSRFIMVALLGFIIYLYQSGWFTPRRVQPPPEAVPVVPDERNNEENNQNNNSDDENSTESDETVPIVLPPRPSAFRVLCTFFISFVTSLIPTAPPQIQQQ